MRAGPEIAALLYHDVTDDPAASLNPRRGAAQPHRLGVRAAAGYS